MRFMFVAMLFLSACSRDAAGPDLAAGTYSGEGRNRLCVTGQGEAQRAGVIAYGAADTNCWVSGRLGRAGARLMLVPAGDMECRIPLVEQGNKIRIGELPAACSYYCGPGATLAGQVFAKESAAEPVTDLAGDPLC